MRRYILFTLAAFVLCSFPLKAQKSGLLRKVAKSVSNEILGTTDETSTTKKTEPEPDCACDQAELILQLGGKLNLDYTELSISVLDDGSVLAKSTMGDEYYIVRKGVAEGPYKPGDPAIKAYHVTDPDENSKDPMGKYGKYISRSGDKFLITFGGKSYGPYARIDNFLVSRSGDKFAALVVKTVAVTDEEGKKMEEAIKNAKTQQEQMELAMKYSQQMQQRVQEGGGAMSTMPTLVTNIPDVKYDFMKSQGETLNNSIKYDDILATTYDKITDLSGNTLLKLRSEDNGASDLFVNTDNTKYAAYKYGALSFSDGKKLSDLFNPRLVKDNGKVFLAYMYYSPKNNAIMQCKIPF